MSGRSETPQISQLEDSRQALPYLGLTFPVYQATLMRLSADPAYLAFGTERGGRPAGLVLTRVGEKGADVLSLVVLPEFRNQGIAGELLRSLEHVLITRGAPNLS